MSESNRRIFPRQDRETSKQEWYFKSSEGIMGPFGSEEEASAMLGAFIESWKKNGAVDSAFLIPAPSGLALGALTSAQLYA